MPCGTTWAYDELVLLLSMQSLEKVFQCFATFWMEMRDLQRQQENEDAEVYKAKVQEHTLETGDEEQAYRDMFPNYAHGYDDLNHASRAFADDDNVPIRSCAVL